MWLSTKAGATKPPSRSTTPAALNWSRPTSSLPSHATTPSRTAIAVASGWVGLCTRPLISRVVGTLVTPQNLRVGEGLLGQPGDDSGRDGRAGGSTSVTSI